MWLESWKKSFKNYSQIINVLGASVGGAYLLLTPEMKADLPTVVVTGMAVLYLVNIVARNIPQGDEKQ